MQTEGPKTHAEVASDDGGHEAFMLRNSYLSGVSRYFLILLISGSVAVVIPYIVEWNEGGWQSNAAFLCIATVLSSLFSKDEPLLHTLLLAFVIFGGISMFMMIVALAYWDGPQLIIDLLAGPFERLGYFPGGDAWFPLSALIWCISTLAISAVAFALGRLLGRLIRRSAFRGQDT